MSCAWRSHVNVLKKPEDYKEIAQLALEEKLAGEAQAVLEQGFEKKVFVTERDIEREQRACSRRRRPRPRTTRRRWPQQDAAARAAPTGDDDVKVGAAVPGLRRHRQGQHQKRIAKGGIAKGKLDEAQRMMRPACCSASPTCATTTSRSREGVQHREAATRPWCASPSSGCSTPESQSARR